MVSKKVIVYAQNVKYKIHFWCVNDQIQTLYYINVQLFREEIKGSMMMAERKSSAAYFGVSCERHCLCEILGQVPCSSLVPVPQAWRGLPPKNPKYKIPPYFMELGLEKEEVRD